MTKKTRKAPRWRGLFLCALERTGNVRASAREAAVDHSLAYQHRNRDAEFAAAWEAALARFGGAEGLALERVGSPLHRLSGGPPSYALRCSDVPRTSCAPSPQRSGEDLVLRQSKSGRAQLVKVGEGRWSPKVEAAFLAHLRATGCIKRAAAGVGFSKVTIHNRRKNYPGFAAACDDALDEALVRLRSLVLGAGIAAFDAPDPEADEADLPKVTVAEAIAILKLKGGGASAGAGGRAGQVEPYAPREPDLKAMQDEVLQRLAAIRRQRGLEE